jgi:hypothetical protein
MTNVKALKRQLFLVNPEADLATCVHILRIINQRREGRSSETSLDTEAGRDEMSSGHTDRFGPSDPQPIPKKSRCRDRLPPSLTK